MNLATVNLNLLVALDALLAERHVTRAAARVGVTQSAMSNALRQLRALFDDPLFVRGPRGVTPTPRALSLAEPVRRGLATLSEAFAEPRFDPASAERTVVLAASDYVELVLLPPLLARIAREAPGVRLEVPGLDGLRLTSSSPEHVVLTVDGVDRPFDVARYGPASSDVFVDSPLGPVQLTALPRFPDPTAALAHGSLLAPMPGLLVRLDVGEGDQVEAGQPLAVVEAMKMENILRAGKAGKVKVVEARPGESLAVDQVILELE